MNSDFQNNANNRESSTKIDVYAQLLFMLAVGVVGTWFLAMVFGNTVVENSMDRDPQFCKVEAPKKMNMPVVGWLYKVALDKCKQYADKDGDVQSNVEANSPATAPSK